MSWYFENIVVGVNRNCIMYICFFNTSFGTTALPNDITLIALLGSSFMILVAYVIAKCCRARNPSFSDEATPAEVVLVIGAFILRFSDNIEEIIQVSIGVAAWHICEWLSGIIVIRKLRRQEEDISLRMRAQTALGENVLLS